MSILQLCWIAVTAATIIFLIVAALSALPKMKTAFTAVIAAVFLAAGGITAFGSIAPLLPGAVAGLLPAAHAAITVRLPPAPAPGVPLSGDVSAGRVTFTFDDGPDVNTPAVIAELNELHLHGVFFLIGDKAAKRPATVAAELANGEVIGNHTWDHKSLTGKGAGTRPLSQAQVRTELSRADAVIVTAGAPEPSLWRPPYGAVNAADDATARALGLRVVLDSGTNIIDSNDWAGLTPAQIARRVDPVLRNATIIAFHDGLRTAGLPIDKSNWAQRLDTPPYEAYAVTTGITFTFGGLKITGNAEVEDTAGHPIPGLYAAGEIVGGLFFHNYASGTGLMSGAVFGRLAGKNAAGHAEK